MTDTEVQVEVQLTSNSPSTTGQQEREADCTESLQNTGQTEAEDPLLMLASVAVAPPCGDHAEEVRRMERSLQSMELQLQFLMSKADYFHDCLVNGECHVEKEALVAAVQSFLSTCQPYFNHLESTRTMSQQSLQHFDIFSRQLCDRLEQLVLTYNSYNLICLDETQPNSVSHFCIGQSQLGPVRVTAFRYCKPTPYLAGVDTGLYKRMRWNVERLGHKQQTDEDSEEWQTEIGGDTEYYFLCYEDIPNPHAEAGGDSEGVPHGNVVRMWSIGQWVPVNPNTDIYDWILCEVPQADYHRLLFLGSDEPSSCSATDSLQQLLLSHQTTE